MPEPDEEVTSMYGSEYGRYPNREGRVMQTQESNRMMGGRAAMPDPDSEVESLIDFESRMSNQRHPF